MNTIQHLNATGLRRTAVALALSGLAALAGAAELPAGNSFHAQIDTSAFSGAGWLDLQFNPGMLPAVGATVTLSHFTGAFGSEFYLEGGASGALPGSITLSNTSSFNDLFHSLTLGGQFGFDVSFGGAYTSTAGTVGTTFSVGLLGADQMSYLGNPDGVLFQVELTPMFGGAPASTSLTMLAGNVASITAVPEPSSYLMLVGGLALLGGALRRQKKN